MKAPLKPLKPSARKLLGLLPAHFALRIEGVVGPGNSFDVNTAHHTLRGPDGSPLALDPYYPGFHAALASLIEGGRVLHIHDAIRRDGVKAFITRAFYTLTGPSPQENQAPGTI